MKKDKRTINVTNIGIIASIVGIISSIALIVMAFTENESLTLGIVLLCASAASLSANLINKKDNR